MQVPTALGPQCEEGIEVGPCPSLDVFGRRAGEREIKQDKAQTAAPAGRCDADVVGLDIAMGDALLFKVIERLEKIFPKPAHQIERGHVIAPQPFGEGAIARLLHEDGGATGDSQRVDNADDVLVMQAAQDSRFGLQAITVRLVDGDLEDQFVILAIAPDQQCVGRAAAAEFADNNESALKLVVPLRDARIDGRRGLLRTRIRLARARYSRNSPAEAIRSRTTGAVDARTRSSRKVPMPSTASASRNPPPSRNFAGNSSGLSAGGRPVKRW